MVKAISGLCGKQPADDIAYGLEQKHYIYKYV